MANWKTTSQENFMSDDVDDHEDDEDDDVSMR
jgi:hypothetical protein